jgi:FKBP-type peptidyl-prolyl cis-trans isomerase (trigger factor)
LIAIALKDKYNLRLSEEEINEIAQSLSEKFNIPMEEVIRFLYSRNSDLLKEMEEQKLFDFISEKIKIKPKKITI